MTPREIDAFLKRETTAHLACQDEARPYVVPIAYAWDGESVYVHSLEGHKVQLMRKHPRVCVQVDEHESMVSWRSVMGWGDFEELHGDDARTAMGKLKAALLPDGDGGRADPFAPPGLEPLAVLFRVRLAEREGRWATP